MEVLHATRPLRFDDVVLIPVQRVRVEPFRGPCGLFVRALAVPHAILVGRAGAWRAYDPSGAELVLEDLLERESGLAEALEAAPGPRGSASSDPPR